jgi:hypothetical protein
MDKLTCEFLHCEATDTLIVVYEHAGRQWGLCPFHNRIAESNKVRVFHEDGKAYLFATVMVSGQ